MTQLIKPTYAEFQRMLEVQLRDMTNAKQEFTAAEVTWALKKDYPSVEIDHTAVRQFTESWIVMEEPKYTWEGRPYTDPASGQTIIARTYTMTPTPPPTQATIIGNAAVNAVKGAGSWLQNLLHIGHSDDEV